MGCRRDEADLSKPPSGEPRLCCTTVARLSLRATCTKTSTSHDRVVRPQERAPVPVMAHRVASPCRMASSSGRLASNHQSCDRRRPIGRGCGLFSLFRAYSRRGHFADDERSPGPAPQKDSCISTRFNRPDRDDHPRPLALDRGPPMAPGSHAKP